jgi:hypothetical protein
VPGTATLHSFLYLVSALPLAGFWLAVLITGVTLALSLAITPLLPAVLIGFAATVRFCAWVEGYLARRLVGAHASPRRVARPRRGYWAAVPAVLGDGAFWRGQAFLLLRAVLGLITGVVTLSFLGAGLQGLAAPLIYRWIPADDGRNGIDFKIWKADTLGKATLLVPLGIALLVATWGLVHLFAAMWRGIASGVLGDRRD